MSIASPSVVTCALMCPWIRCQTQVAGRLQDQGEVQRLRSQLQRAQGSMHAQELELERLRLLQEELGDSRREQQVSCSVAANAPAQVEMDRDKDVLWVVAV